MESEEFGFVGQDIVPVGVDGVPKAGVQVFDGQSSLERGCKSRYGTINLLLVPVQGSLGPQHQ